MKERGRKNTNWRRKKKERRKINKGLGLSASGCKSIQSHARRDNRMPDWKYFVSLVSKAGVRNIYWVGGGHESSSYSNLFRILLKGFFYGNLLSGPAELSPHLSKSTFSHKISPARVALMWIERGNLGEPFRTCGSLTSLEFQTRVPVLIPGL